MQDADFLRKVRDEKKTRKAVIVGGGLIGMETCEALRRADIDITVVELLPQVLTFLDWQLAKLVELHIRSKGANVILDNGVAEFLGEDERLVGVKLANGTELECELAVVAIGVVPNSRLAKDAGLQVGKTGGIVVDEHMQTSDPDIYAVGDCVEVTNLMTGEKTYAPYGDLANLEGRVAGENAVEGNIATFPGTIKTGICKIFDYAAGTTGLSESAARAAHPDGVETVVNAGLDTPGFMGGKLLVTKLVAERSGGRILGAQCIGPGDVSKQIAIWAMAIKGNLTVDDMANADLPYAPPFSLAIDHSGRRPPGVERETGRGDDRSDSATSGAPTGSRQAPCVAGAARHQLPAGRPRPLAPHHAPRPRRPPVLPRPHEGSGPVVAGGRMVAGKAALAIWPSPAARPTVEPQGPYASRT